MVKKNLVHILMTDYILDSRVRNETVYLAKDNYNVDVYCLNSKITSGDEIREGVNLKRFGIVGNRIFTYITAYIMMFLYILNKKVDCIHAHDANALPVAYLMSKIKRVPFIYDSHELWSHSEHSVSSKIIINIVAYMEKFFAKRAKSIITVSESIQSHLCNYFDVEKIHLVRNIPSYTHQGEYNLFREKYKLPKNTKICLYQGIIDDSRGVDLIADASIEICKKYDNVVFFFLGDGSYLEKLKLQVKEADLEYKIRLLGRISQNELLKYTKSADIGIHAISDTCLNHRYCLPNKVFEYLHSGLVLIVTDLVELSKFVTDNEVGLTFKDGDVNSLVNSIDMLLSDDVLLDNYKQNTIDKSLDLTWSNEYKSLQIVYKEILG